MTKKELLLETGALIISALLIVTALILQNYQLNNTLIMILFGLAFIIGGFEKAKEGIQETIENKALNVEILMIIAALSAFLVGDFFEGAILIFIFGLSGVLESWTSSKSEKELTNLLNLSPKTALLLKDDAQIEIPIQDLQIGDIVIVKVGAQVPVDGILFEGSTSLDQSPITGESMPIDKQINDSVYAGSINLEKTVLIQTTKDPKDSVLEKIIAFVADAQENKTESHTLIKRIEKYYVYFIIGFALLMMFIPPLFHWLTLAESFRRGIIVLVVGSPCALVASISPAMLSSLSNAARHRLLIKSGRTLEDMVGIKTVAFDKTGTITKGEPEVIHFEVLKQGEPSLRDLIYSIEKQSDHPLAKAITAYLGDVKDLNIETSEVSGHGMSTNYNNSLWKVGRSTKTILDEKLLSFINKGYSMVYISKDDVLIAYFALADTLREQTQNVVQSLKKQKITSVLLTGDHASTAQVIAKEAGIEHVEADLLPQDKVEIIKQIQKQYGKVLMVGDGINDAPALAQADVSVAMGGGTDVSLETADIVFMNNRLDNLPKLVRLAKRMRRITLQNIIFSLSIISLLMITNLFGWMNLPLGVIAHEGSTILVILNSLRLLVK
ncbi:MAG: heavy metal translocating P-type ATPase [Acholeplasmataceae bacterium]|nr:cadmium-translocating P-type ATPase [Acholeplasmataceae bacterium]